MTSAKSATRDHYAAAADELAADLRVKQPLIASDSIDVVVSNGVLNVLSGPGGARLQREQSRSS